MNSLPIIFRLHYNNLTNELVKYKTINTDTNIIIYIDTRSIIPHLYGEDMAKLVLKNKEKRLIAKGILELIYHYKKYFKKYEFKNNARFILFSETGESLYHKKIFKNYKANRKITKLNLYGSNELKESIQKQMYQEIVETYQYLNTTYSEDIICYNLDYLEADFIPLYIMYKYKLYNDNNFFNIILSKDKDLLQCLINDNIIQITKPKKEYRFNNCYNAIQTFDKDNISNYKENKAIIYGYIIAIILAVLGDRADNVEGIQGIGFKTIYKFLNKLFDLSNINDFISIDDIIDKIEQLNINDNTGKKLLNNIDKLQQSYKLVSFKELIDSLTPKTKIEPYHNITLDTSIIENIDKGLQYEYNELYR